MTADLHAVFQSAAYRVTLPDRSTHTLCIGQTLPDALAAWLARSGWRTAWIITAHNPQGRAVAAWQNRAREALLTHCVEATSLPALSAHNQDPTGQWPDEPGWLIAGLSEDAMVALARRFGQAAVVCLGPVPPSLIWIKG